MIRRAAQPQQPMKTMLHPSRGALLRAAGLVAALATGAPAQTPSPAAAAAGQDVIKLSEFVVSTSADRGYRAGNSVSATRVDTAIKDLPFAITAFTDQFIADIGARELNDIVVYAPGVTTGSKEFTQGNTRLSIRGFDGDVTQQRNGFVGNRYVDAGNIQRVEVVKGPSSLLYGQITPGGTVNYITKRPVERSFTSIRQQVGTDRYLRTDLDVNQAVRGGQLLARVVAAYENQFEWADPGKTKSTLLAPSVTVRLPGNSALVVDYEWFSRRETPLVSMKPNLAVNVGATAANFPNLAARARAQAYVDVGNLNLGFIGYPPLPASFNYVGAHDYRKSDFDTIGAEYSVKLGANWSARANYSFNKFYLGNKLTGLAEFTVTPAAAYHQAAGGPNRFDYVAELRANPLAVLRDPAKTATAILTKRKRLEESWNQSNSYQVEVTGRLGLGGATVKPLVGAFLSAVKNGARRRESTTAPPVATPNAATTPGQHFQPWNFNDPATWDRSPDYDPTLGVFNNHRTGAGEDSALYGLINVALLNGRFVGIGGVRHNRAESEGFNFLTNTPDAPYTATKTTPQIGAGFKVRRDVLLFGSYSESFFIEERNLTLFNPAYDRTRPTSATNPLTLSEAAKPTTGKGYEFGVKTDLQDGRISSTLSVFHLEREDRILRFRELGADGTFPTITRQGTVDESRGVELEVTYSPTDRWQVYASYTAMDIKTTKATIPPIPNNPDPVYQAAYVAAYHEAARLILNAVPEGSAERLASLWTRYSFKEGALNGAWLGGGANYVSPKAQRTANPTLFFEAYTLFDAVAGYDFKLGRARCSAMLSCKNITDEEYFPANQARGLPRRFVLSVETRF
jgi:iron complex outermembrane receptor protein